MWPTPRALKNRIDILPKPKHLGAPLCIRHGKSLDIVCIFLTKETKGAGGQIPRVTGCLICTPYSCSGVSLRFRASQHVEAKIFMAACTAILASWMCTHRSLLQAAFFTFASIAGWGLHYPWRSLPKFFVRWEKISRRDRVTWNAYSCF